MAMDKEQLIARFEEFMSSIKDSERVVVVHHRDADGLCSAVVFSKALSKISGNPVASAINSEYSDFGEVIAALKEIKPDRIAILDLSIDQSRERVLELEKIAPLLIIDHHKLYNDCNSERTVFIKAQMVSELDGSKYPASKLVFDLCSRLTDLQEERWIACVGLLGDMGYNTWKEFVDLTAKESGVSLGEMNSLKGLISAVETVKPEKFPELFSEFHSKKPAQILRSPLNRYKKKLLKELTKWRKDFKENAEFFPEAELYFYVFKPKVELKSALIDSLTFEFPDKTIVIVLDLGEKMLRFSARRQDFRVKMNSLLEEAVKGIPAASAGGHIPAAAGSVPRSKLNTFKENVIRILKRENRKR